MRVILEQNELEAAIREQVIGSFNVPNSKRIDIDFVRDRSAGQMTAVIEIVDQNAPAMVRGTQVSEAKTENLSQVRFQSASANTGAVQSAPVTKPTNTVSTQPTANSTVSAEAPKRRGRKPLPRDANGNIIREPKVETSTETAQVNQPVHQDQIQEIELPTEIVKTQMSDQDPGIDQERVNPEDTQEAEAPIEAAPLAEKRLSLFSKVADAQPAATVETVEQPEQPAPEPELVAEETPPPTSGKSLFANLNRVVNEKA